MHRQSVVSSNIRSIGYDADTRELEVEFTNGTSYIYYDVPYKVHFEFLDAESHGEYFASHIKNSFSYKKL
jgi:KTSC domain